ncbi:MAG TPA: CHAT domain-containing protein, partial [Thermoanaerobaculia bacterium]|nr:CHAT domain-containing protein [Thermoanaerobaculia bacterium]
GLAGLLAATFVLLYSMVGRSPEGLERIRQGDVEEGFASLRRDLDRSGEERVEALLDLAEAYVQLGDGSTALDHLAAVQELIAAESPESRARRFWLQGRALELTGRPRDAVSSFQLGLEEPGTPLAGRLLCAIGRTLTESDRAEAQRVLLRALGLARDPATRAEALAALGGLEGSENRMDQALALAREAGDPWMEIGVLTQKARISGMSPDRAAALVEEAIRIAEGLRSQVRARDLALLLSARLEPEYDRLIDLLLELHESWPHAGYAARAFAASEASQAAALARGLRDRRPEPELQEKLLARLSFEPGSLRVAADRVERDRLLGEYWKNRADRSIASEPGPPTDVEAVRQLLDPGTVLLEYSLGTERSWLFVVSGNGLRVFPLPPEPEIAQAVSSLRSNPRDPDTLAAVGRMLIGPASSELRGRRIVVVADGVLGLVPFALLPEPSDEGSPLLERHEIVHIPSASVLAALRRDSERRSPPPHRLAALADPVVSLNDRRIPPEVRTLPLADPGKSLGFLPFAGSRREAEGAAALYPKQKSLLATGFAVNRSLFTDGSLSRYGILHLAIPALIDIQRADESSLVLSEFDEQGRPRNGLMPGYEIFGLRLPCDLAVLSSGRSGFGKAIPGEGYAGLSQAFLAAGAARVIDTIWDVEDRSAAELMIRLHRHLASGSLPSQALRQAQLEMRAMPELSRTVDWAAFRIEGDWR